METHAAIYPATGARHLARRPGGRGKPGTKEEHPRGAQEEGARPRGSDEDGGLGRGSSSYVTPASL